MDKRLFIYHLHSDYSSCTTNIDSVTKVSMYVERAKELGMTALAFSEHGNIFNWYEKKSKIEAAGMKYIHAVEAYLTYSITDKARDNYHCVLLAKNYEGFLELNELVSNSFNREDGHFYYTPRITLDELYNTSNNIVVCTACLGSLLSKGTEQLKEDFIKWLVKHKDRCFLEIQHHNTQPQKEYNQYLYNLHKQTGIRLITGTDTHSLNEKLAEARVILQRAKNTYFDEEEDWDLTFKSYDQLIESYKIQDALPLDIIKEAISNTIVLEDMCEYYPFEDSIKYPKLWEDPSKELRDTVYHALEIHPYALENHTKEEMIERIEEELAVFDAIGMQDFILFQKLVRDWERKNGVGVGPGRGSVSASFVAYLLGITDIDAIRFGLKFFRFANKDRVSLGDIDSDYYDEERNKVRNFLLHYDKVESCEVAAFNTVALKGAILDVGRALEIPLQEVREISKRVVEIDKKDVAPEDLRSDYPELFKYVDLINGTIVSMGTHPAGVLCATKDISKEIGMCTVKGNPNLVSCLDKYAVEALNFTKIDALGLDSIGLINKTCQMVGLPKLTPDIINIDDWEVWKDIRDDATSIFQYESDFAQQTLKAVFSDKNIEKYKKEVPNFSYLKLFSFVNALIRPCGSSIINDVKNGVIKKTGIADIDELLAPELGNCIMQETFMEFAMKFCGFTQMEADTLRKCIAYDTDILMSDGTTKKIQNIKVGDRVQTFDNGIFHGENVVNKFNNGEKEVYKVLTNNGFSVEATKDHKFLTQRGWIELKDLTLEDSLFIYQYSMSDFVTLKIKDISFVGVKQVYDIEVENTHNFLANNIVVHNCIAKKKETQDQLDKLYQGFKQISQPKYNLSDEKTEEIIQPILKCVLDATRYAFSICHSDAYSFIGYACGYLRHYYPLEYIASCFNVWQDKEEKTIMITDYCRRNNIRIEEPKFGRSKAEYYIDRNEKKIYKGVKSIKFLNESVGNELYKISKEKKYKTFVELLYDITNICNSRQLEILIRLDYFDMFGNSKELLKIYKMFTEFNDGKASQIKKEKIEKSEILTSIVKRFSKETAKQYRELNTPMILKECESYIKCCNLPDLPLKNKIADQKEYLGYISIKTSKEEDRPKLIVLDKKVLIAKTGKNAGKPWCVSIKTHSIGSGKVSNFSIFYNVFAKEKFEVGDIIYCDKYSRNREYFYIDKYHIII